MMNPMDDASEHSSGAVDDLAAVSDAAATSAQRARPRRRQRHPMRIAVIGGVLVAIVLAVVYGRVYIRRETLLRVQQACLDYAPPADQVVYDEHPARAKELLARGGDYVSVPTGGGTDTTPIAGLVATAWRDLSRWVMPDRPDPRNAVLFLHQRQTRIGGKIVLVCVEADRAARKLRFTLVHPATSTFDPVVVTDLDLSPPPQPDLIVLKAGGDPFDAKLPSNVADRADLRFFAGQFDAQDATRFNPPYEFTGQRGEFDCWLESERMVYFVDRRFAKMPS
jgi:hypothetical protein